MTHLRSMALVVFSIFALTNIVRADETVEPLKTDVFVGQQEDYFCYRIPALITTKAGTLLAIAEGRKANRNDQGDIDLVVKRSEDGGLTWSPLELIYEEGGTANVAIDNPCPVVDRETGRIWLPFCRRNSAAFITYSDDDGRTWAKPRDITSQVIDPAWNHFFTGPGVSIILSQGPHKGRIVVPVSHRFAAEATGPKMIEQGPSWSRVCYSDDNGQTWKCGAPLDVPSNECQVVELSDDKLLLNARNNREARSDSTLTVPRVVARSTDGGETWEKATVDTTLVEPICQASLIRIGDASGDRRLLFSNPASSQRDHLTVRLSEDDGQTWRASRVLEPEGRTAYSCLAVLPDGSIGCLYERGQDHYSDRLTFARFPLEWISSEPPTP